MFTLLRLVLFFFFNDTATTEIYTLSLHDALPILRREGTDVTVIAYMGMMYRALEAAEELAKEGISVEIVDPRTLRPMDTETIIGSVRKTHRAVVVEAGARLARVGSGDSPVLTQGGLGDPQSPLQRRAGEDAPMP